VEVGPRADDGGGGREQCEVATGAPPPRRAAD
jgi:hypothetical protein